MIRSFAHQGLERFFLMGSHADVQPIHAKRLRLILAMLNDVSQIEDMAAPGLYPQAVKGELKNYWAVTVQLHWQILFKFEEGNAHAVDYLNYH